MFPCRCRRFLCFIPLLSVLSLHSQTTAPDTGNAVTTIKTKVGLVLVDVVVTNNKGDAVTGLQKQDFEISEMASLKPFPPLKSTSARHSLRSSCRPCRPVSTPTFP
jgi:PHD/YefM family antitoxin component YafN of YafNO toxin-antitoxin module